MRPITNPDFNQEFSKWQDILSSASDAEIKHYLLTGDPVAKLAAAAVQDAKAKTMQAPQAPVQSVIAQKAAPQGLAAIPQGQAPMPQAQPQMPPQGMADGGLTELSTGGMFDEASYAGGGIVSFDEGGSVKHFVNTGLVTGQARDFDPMSTLSYEDYMKLPPELKAKHQGKVVFQGNEDLKDPTGQGKVHTGLRSGFNRMLGVDNRINPTYATGEPTSSAFERGIVNPITESIANAERDAKTLMRTSSKKFTDVYGNQRGVFEQETPSQLKAREQRLAEAYGAPKETATDEGRQQRTAAFLANEARQQLADPNYLAMVSGKKPPAPADDADLRVASPNLSGVGSLHWKDISANDQGYKDLMRPEVSAQEKMAEMRGLIGQDPNREARNKRLAAMEERTAKEEANIPWMSLAEFGIGLTGARKGQEFQTLSESGIKSLRGYAASKERVNAAREKQFELYDRQSQADRAEQVAIAQYGDKSAEAIRAKNDATKLAGLTHKNEVELKNATGRFEAEKGNAEIGLKKLEISQAAAANTARLKMMEKQITASGLASQARIAAIKQKALADLKNNDAYNARLTAITKKYKDSGGATNPLHIAEVNALNKEFMANHLETIFGDGLSANAIDADTIAPLSQ